MTSLQTGVLSASNNTVVAPLPGDPLCIIAISGSFTGLQITINASNDNGVTYFNLGALRADTQQIVSGTLTIPDNTTIGYQFVTSIFTTVVVKCISISSGAATVRITTASSENFFYGGGSSTLLNVNVGTTTDHSSSITTGGSSQLLMSANTSRKYLFIQNNSANDLWFNFSISAVLSPPSIKLLSNAVYTMEGTSCSAESINIIGATTGQSFTVKEL